MSKETNNRPQGASDSAFQTEVKERAVELIAGEIDAVLSSWTRTKALRDAEPDLAETDAIDLLAAWGHLHRFSEATHEKLAQVVAEDASLLAQLTASGLHPEGWIAELRLLEEATDSTLCDEDVFAARDMALRLFRDLDDAELACWAAARLGCAETVQKTRRELDECAAEFVLHSDLFNPIADFARGMLCAYRPDLFGFDADLFMITEKYTLLVDEDVLVPWGEEEDEPFTQEEAAALAEAARAAARRRRKIISLPTQTEPLAAAADAGFTAPIGPSERIEFEAEDGSWTGFVCIPETIVVSPEEERLALSIFDANGEPIEDAVVVFCGREFPVQEGRAIISLNKFLELWNQATDQDVIHLRYGGKESVGRVIFHPSGGGGDEKA